MAGYPPQTCCGDVSALGLQRTAKEKNFMTALGSNCLEHTVQADPCLDQRTGPRVRGQCNLFFVGARAPGLI